MTPRRETAEFRYGDCRIDRARGRLVCRYSLGARHFEERIDFGPDGDWEAPAVGEAARLVHLLAGVSYYKTGAPGTIDLGDVPTTPAERAFLRSFYVDGLAEFAFRNRIDLTDLVVRGPDLTRRGRTEFSPRPGSPLVPFGGGIDSIVTADHVREHFPGSALFVVSGSDGRFDAIERPAKVTGLPVLRAERAIDRQLLGSGGRQFLNGHVPVTGIISAMAVLAAVLDRRDAVVMSNEWSASVGNLTEGDRVVNHQYSKGAGFEGDLRGVLADVLDPPPQYFSLLRPFSELWVARRFAALTQFHHAFRSCNRAFRLDPAQRLETWCGVCDKCCFIDLVLSPFLSPGSLDDIFGGAEPLQRAELADRFRTLLGTSAEAKPFECVGDVGECRTALLAAAERTDRRDSRVLHQLAREVREAGGAPGGIDHQRPMGDHHVPEAYQPHELPAADQLV